MTTMAEQNIYVTLLNWFCVIQDAAASLRLTQEAGFFQINNRRCLIVL